MKNIKMREETEKWLKSAREDLRKAEDNFKIKNYDLSSFLCQQTVEKALKAMLIEKTGKFPKIHDLIRLGKLIKIDKNLLEGCEKLTYVYTETRYPDTGEREYTKEESKEDIMIAKNILKWIIKKI